MDIFWNYTFKFAKDFQNCHEDDSYFFSTELNNQKPKNGFNSSIMKPLDSNSDLVNIHYNCCHLLVIC